MDEDSIAWLTVTHPAPRDALTSMFAASYPSVTHADRVGLRELRILSLAVGQQSHW